MNTVKEALHEQGHYTALAARASEGVLERSIHDCAQEIQKEVSEGRD